MSVSNLLAACVTVSAYTVIGNPRRESQASEDRHSVRAPVAIRQTQLAHNRCQLKGSLQHFGEFLGG